METKHIGSSFDDFLQEDGLLSEAESIAWKRVIAFQVAKEMEEKQISKANLTKMMHTSCAAVDRLLDSNNSSLTLLTLEKVAQVLGKS